LHINISISALPLCVSLYPPIFKLVVILVYNNINPKTSVYSLFF
jgi:hypothetical protein